MIGALLSGLFNLILNLLATVIQIVCVPLNTLITSLLPDISSSITGVTTGITNLMSYLPWALSILPLSFITTLGVCWTIRLAVANIHISTHTSATIYQNLIFWNVFHTRNNV